MRTRKGMTRRTLALSAELSERHLANLEQGTGNVSVLVLHQVARALGCTLGELLESTPELHAIRNLVEGRSREEIDEAAAVLARFFAARVQRGAARRVALVGLRGAGKSTLGPMLARELEVPFIEMTPLIERLAGCSVSEIHALYGQDAYRRYERRALDTLIANHPDAVIAVPGGLVSDATSYGTLLASCLTVWLKAEPEDHMHRVAAQGDTRPMAGNREAMEDLRRILAARTALYARANLTIDTSAGSLREVFATLKRRVRAAFAARAPDAT